MKRREGDRAGGINMVFSIMSIILSCESKAFTLGVFFTVVVSRLGSHFSSLFTFLILLHLLPTGFSWLALHFFQKANAGFGILSGAACVAITLSIHYPNSRTKIHILKHLSSSNSRSQMPEEKLPRTMTVKEGL